MVDAGRDMAPPSNAGSSGPADRSGQVSPPRFVIVGHPNKGKSSIVATLAQDDAVRIAPEPGTTTTADDFALRVDGELLYTLVDTPGFQRARAVLAWLRQHETDASSHPSVVRAFVEAEGHAAKFPDEVALLEPLVRTDEPTGILYVVDGSTPYGPEYEPEMEVLRWTGRPRMALVNPIGRADHIPEWRDALGQFFSTVRTFDAVRAPWAKRIELLEAFGELDDSWRPAVKAGAAALRRDRELKRRQAAELIARSAIAALRYAVERRLRDTQEPASVQAELESAYRAGLVAQEHEAHDRVEEVYGFVHLRRESGETASLTESLGELFAESTWNRMGLSKKQLLAAGALGAAGGGAVLDVAAHGLSFGVFTAAGAVLGAAGAWWGGEQLPKTRVLGLPMGGRLASVGPTKNPNFAFVWLGRARLHHALVAARTHARRDVMRVDLEGEVSWDAAVRKRVVACVTPVMKKPKDERVAADAERELAEVCAGLFAADALDSR